MIRVVVNGRECELGRTMTLADYLRDLGLERQHIAVAHNGDVLGHEEYPDVVLEDGDALEIVRPIGGG